MNGTTRTTHHGLPLSHPAAGAGNAFSTIVRTLREWSDRRATRAALRRLDPHLLRDIGIEEDRARREALRHFWLE